MDIRNLSCAYGGLISVDDVSLKVDAGEIVALIGPNGAGKTTLLNAIGGLVRPKAGTIIVNDQEITSLSCWRRATLGLARSFQLVRLFPDLKVAGNVQLGLAARGYPGFFSSLMHLPQHQRYQKETRDAALAALDAVHLADLAQRPASALSHGQGRRIELARAVVARAALVLLDEPTSGLHSGIIRDIIPIIRSMAKQGAALVLVEHNLKFVGEVADRVIVLHQGRVIATGSKDEVMRNRLVIDAYLGGSRKAHVAAETVASNASTS